MRNEYIDRLIEIKKGENKFSHEISGYETEDGEIVYCLKYKRIAIIGDIIGGAVAVIICGFFARDPSAKMDAALLTAIMAGFMLLMNWISHNSPFFKVDTAACSIVAYKQFSRADDNSIIPINDIRIFAYCEDETGETASLYACLADGAAYPIVDRMRLCIETAANNLSCVCNRPLVYTSKKPEDGECVDVEAMMAEGNVIYRPGMQTSSRK